MGKAAPKPPVDFNEALRRIAQTPKDVVDQVVSDGRDAYNDGKQEGSTPPAKGSRKTTD